MLLSGLPPLVRQGDALPAQFTAAQHHRSRARGRRCARRVEGLTEPLAPQTVTLAAGEARVVEWPIQVPPTAETLRYTIEASAPDGPTDRLAVTQRVLPAVPVRTLQATLLRWEPAPGWAERRRRARADPPADALPDRGGIDVAAAASLGGTLEPLAKWLRDYPYSCLEQKVSVAVGLGDATRWQEVSAALPSYVDGDGLLKFFPTMQTGSEVLTAYVLAISNAAGWTLPPSVQDKMVDGLRGFVDGSIRARLAAAPRPIWCCASSPPSRRWRASAAPSPIMLDSITHRAQPVADLGGARLVEHPAARAGDRRTATRACAPPSRSCARA